MQLKQVEQELKVLIGARCPIIYVISWEESRVEESIRRVIGAKRLYIWSITNGLIETKDGEKPRPVANSLAEALSYVIDSDENAVFVFRDLHPFMRELTIIRKLRDVCCSLTKTRKTMIIVSPLLEIPTELEKDINILDYPLPNLNEIEGILSGFCASAKDNPSISIELQDPAHKERIVKAALGLTEMEIENVFAKAIVTDGKLDISDVDTILAEKKQIIRKSGVLEYYDNAEDMSNVGGIDELKDWVKKRTKAFSEDARKFGLPEPKGILLVGVQGCGKSLCAKSIASLWKLPLLKFDMGAIFTKWLGESESNLRKAIKIAESISPVVFWVDELEKGFAGMTSGSGDGGTGSRIFGAFLTWMQEKTKPVFVVATANNISLLPPELLRKGRFDEIFFVDLPGLEERKEILKIHIEKKKRKIATFDIDELAHLSNGFSGAELEQVIVASLYEAFDSNTDLSQKLVCNNIRATVPLSTTMHEQIENLRKWAKDRARPATRSSEPPCEVLGTRKIERID